MATAKVTVTAAKKKAWAAFSVYIRTRDARRDLHITHDMGVAFCFTCGKLYPVKGTGTMQAGHFIPGRNNMVLFDERQVHAQCYNCNVNLKGNWPAYYRKMVEKYGLETVTTMIDTHHEILIYKPFELLAMADDYKTRTVKLLAV